MDFKRDREGADGLLEDRRFPEASLGCQHKPRLPEEGHAGATTIAKTTNLSRSDNAVKIPAGYSREELVKPCDPGPHGSLFFCDWDLIHHLILNK